MHSARSSGEIRHTIDRPQSACALAAAITPAERVSPTNSFFRRQHLGERDRQISVVQYIRTLTSTKSFLLRPSVLRPRSANPFEHVSLARIGPITRPGRRPSDLQHHDVLLIGSFSQLIAYLFSAHVTGPRGDQPESRDPVPPFQILCPQPFNECPFFRPGHVFDGDHEAALHCSVSVLC